MSNLSEILSRPIRRVPTVEEIAEADEIFFNFFNNLFENNEITINWCKESKINFSIKNLIKISILDINYNIHNLIDYTYPYIEFVWNDNSIFKILIYVDKNNKTNMEYIRKYNLLYNSEGNTNMLNVINNEIENLKNKIEWYNFRYDLREEKFCFTLNENNIYKILFSYYLILLIPLFNSSGGFSISIIDVMEKIVYDKYMDELNIISNKFSFNIKYEITIPLVDELLKIRNQEELLLSVDNQLNNSITDFYTITIKYNLDEEKINENFKIQNIHNEESYKSLLWLIYNIFTTI